MTACSTSPKLFRRTCLMLVIVTLQFVTPKHTHSQAKLGANNERAKVSDRKGFLCGLGSCFLRPLRLKYFFAFGPHDPRLRSCCEVCPDETRNQNPLPLQ